MATYEFKFDRTVMKSISMTLEYFNIKVFCIMFKYSFWHIILEISINSVYKVLLRKTENTCMYKLLYKDQ